MKKTSQLFFLLWLKSILLLTCFLTACHNSGGGWSFEEVDVVSLTIEPNTLSLYPNQEKQLTAFLIKGPSKTNITDQARWLVDDPTIAAVDTGVVTAKTIGTTNITASLDGAKATATLTVNKNELVSIEVEPANAEIYPNEMKQYKAVGFYSDQSNKDISEVANWSVIDSSIASIDTKGLLTALSPGKTSVVVDHSTLNASADTNITVKTGTLTGLQMPSDEIDLTVGLKRQMVATGTFSNGTSKDVSFDCDWSSDAPNIASVSNEEHKGLVTGIAVGETKINASFSSQSTSSTIKVHDAKITKITVSPNAFTLTKGYSRQLQAVAKYENDSILDITESAKWKSANISLATVDPLGNVSAHMVGETTITATFDKQNGQSNFTIIAPTLTSMTIYPVPATSELTVNTPQQLLAQGIFSNGDELDLTSDVTWISSDSNIASVDAGGKYAGLVTPHAAGNVAISAVEPITSTIASIALPVKDASLTRIDLEPVNPDIPINTQIQMNATGTFSDGGKIDITTDCDWSTGSGAVAEVSPQGLVTGKSINSTTITASFLTKEVSTNLNVSNKQLTAIEISPQNPTLKPVTYMFFTATALYSDGSEQNITRSGWWRSSDWNIASTVNWWPVWKGRVHASGTPGECDISFEYQGIKVSTRLTVKR